MLSAQYYCEPKTALKITLLKNNVLFVVLIFLNILDIFIFFIIFKCI